VQPVSLSAVVAKCGCIGVLLLLARVLCVLCSVENMSRRVLWKVTIRQKSSSLVILHLPVCPTQPHSRMYVSLAIIAAV